MAAAGTIALAGTVQAGAPAPPLEPDLVTVTSGENSSTLYTKHNRRGKFVLRIANTVANAGAGPLELSASEATNGDGHDCIPGQYPEDDHDLDAIQRIFGDDDEPANGYDPDDTEHSAAKVGCFEWHEKHNHWHFQDFARFALRDKDSDEVVEGRRGPMVSRKIGFCIVDSGGQRFPELPGTPSSGVYPEGENGCGLGNPDGGPGRMGLSVGYSDLYSASTQGQRLNITGIKRRPRRYCLVSTANPPGGSAEIQESDTANNSLRRLIRINPRNYKAFYIGKDC